MDESCCPHVSDHDALIIGVTDDDEVTNVSHLFFLNDSADRARFPIFLRVLHQPVQHVCQCRLLLCLG
jgi:hypothetical protein